MAQTNTADVQKALGGIDYPASKQDLLDHAKSSNDSDDEVIKILNQLLRRMSIKRLVKLNNSI